MTRPLRAYLVTHRAGTTLSVVVAARTAREALEKELDREDVIDDWAGEEWPLTSAKARRAPAYDTRAAALSKEERP